jgi:uncharacterized protein
MRLQGFCRRELGHRRFRCDTVRIVANRSRGEWAIFTIFMCAACRSRTAAVSVAPVEGGVATVASSASLDPCTDGHDEPCGEILEKSGDIPGAIRRYQAACERGDPAGCHKLASKLIATEPHQAHRIEVKNCNDQHFVESCSQLGWMKLKGVGCEADLEQAAKLLGEACTQGDWFGCTTLGVMYRDGSGVTRDYAKALSLLEPYCPKVPYACDNVGALYALGWGVPKDEAKAVSLYKLACDRTFIGGCRDLAKAYLRGHGVARDDVEGLRLLRLSCDHDHGTACYELGEAERDGLYGVTVDKRAAFEHFTTACTNAAAEGCNAAGWLAHTGDGVSQDDVRAVSFFQRACDGGNAFGCTNLGVRFAKGEGVARDALRAARLYEKACNAEQGNGCANLAMAYENGTGVAKDPALAKKLYERACAAGLASSCSHKHP